MNDRRNAQDERLDTHSNRELLLHEITDNVTIRQAGDPLVHAGETDCLGLFYV